MGVKNSGRKWLENLEKMSLLLLQKIASKYSGMATSIDNWEKQKCVKRNKIRFNIHSMSRNFKILVIDSGDAAEYVILPLLVYINHG